MSVEAWTFTFDLPLAALNPNGNRPHWAMLNRARVDYRDECIAEIEKVLIRDTGRRRIAPPWPVACVAVAARVCVGRRGGGRYRPVDVPNLIYAFKGGYDALTHTGVIVDDRYTSMGLGPHTIEPVGPDDAEGVIVTVSQMGVGVWSRS